MPTYEYECQACRQHWELEQRITDAPARTCPTCGKSTGERLISRGTGFSLKGGGWAADKYGSSRPR